MYVHIAPLIFLFNICLPFRKMFIRQYSQLNDGGHSAVEVKVEVYTSLYVEPIPVDTVRQELTRSQAS